MLENRLSLLVFQLFQKIIGIHDNVFLYFFSDIVEFRQFCQK